MVGIDLEVAAVLDLEDAEFVLDQDELRFASLEPGRLPTLLWSAKESAFKAWSAAKGIQGVDPRTIHIEARSDGLRAELIGHTVPPLVGGWREAGGMLVTALVDPSPPSIPPLS